jgi:hypothetical protein
VGAVLTTVETDRVDIVCVIEVVTSGTTVNHTSPVRVVVDGSAVRKPASTDGNAPIQEHASDNSDLSYPDRTFSAVSQDSVSLRRLFVALAGDVTKVVRVVLETINSVEVMVMVLVGTSVSVVVLDITSRAVTTPPVATPSAEVQYAEAAEFEVRQE